MNRIQGAKSDYAQVKREGTQIIISYGYTEIDEDEATWYEVCLPAAKFPLLSFADVKAAIEADINAQTDRKIISGFVWNPEGTEEEIPVWLSQENQFNFKSAYDLAVQKNGATLPVTFKMGEDAEGNPVYHTFETMAEADDFYTKAVAFIHRTLEEGWNRKDAVEWASYEEMFPTAEQTSEE